MSQDELTKYYLLCTMRMGTKAHIINELSGTNMEIVFTKKEINLFLRRVNNSYIAREVVVGGEESSSQQQYVRQPVIIID